MSETDEVVVKTFNRREELAKHELAKATVAGFVAAEIKRAEANWGATYASAHEAFGVLLEEVEEFKAEVWKKRSERDRRQMIDELVQVACVAQRFAAQLMKEQGGPLCGCGAALERADAVAGIAFCRECQAGVDAFDLEPPR